MSLYRGTYCQLAACIFVIMWFCGSNVSVNCRVSGNATNSTSTANATMPTESSGLSTKLIIIIAASGGGGLVLLIVVVFVCCCVKLKRRGKGSISASGDFVASNNPLRTLAESKSGVCCCCLCVFLFLLCCLVIWDVCLSSV